jgi:hypothetical protein
MHNFKDSQQQGNLGEAILDNFVIDKWQAQLQWATYQEQLQGIDRLMIIHNKAIPIEYKTDYIGHKTKMFFIETSISDKGKIKNGWARYSKADTLFYYFYHLNKVYVFKMQKIRDNLNNWKEKYKYTYSHNVNNYVGRGLLIPIDAISEFYKEFDL